MKKRILSLTIILLLVLTTIPITPINASSVAVWKNGGVSISAASAVGYSDIGYGFAKLSVTDARGYIPTPNLDESPYYLLLGMDGLMPAGSEADGGRWAQLHISSGERNCNWYANDEIYIVFPNAGSSSRNITVIDSKDGTAQMEGVPFMPQTAYVFKFAKENNMLVIYCNGIKVFEGAAELDVFSDDNLWFTTKGNVGAYDTYTSYPLLINPTSGMTEDLATYYTTGPKSGCNGYSSYVTDITAENMMALYDSEGYVCTIIDSTHNDGGNPAQVGESVSTNSSNTNKQFEISVIADSISNGNWCTIGVYDPSTGEKSLAQSGNTLRFTMTGGVYNSLSFYYDGGSLPLIEMDARVNENELNKIRLKLIAGDVNRINVYYNDVLQKAILDTDENTAELFSLMNAETLRVGIVGNKGTTNLENPDIIRFKVDNGTNLNVTMTLDKESYNVGECIIATTTLTNSSDTTLNNVTVQAKSSAQIIPVSGSTKAISAIAAGETVKVKQVFRAIEGGRPMLNVKTLLKNGMVAFNSQQFVSVNGTGWYEGDSHSHSVYSDGAGTIAQNSASAYKKGLSWLYSTDHNSISQWEQAAPVTESYTLGDFINIAGDEFTSCNNGHALGYRLPYDLSSNFSETENQSNWVVNSLGSSGETWNDIISSVKNMGGIFYVAHPNSGTIPTRNVVWSFPEVYDVTGITGVEVWNASEGVKHLQNTVALKIWDQLNVRGDKLLGIADSDGHGTPAIGAAHIKGYLTSLSKDNINTLLESGSYYGTNGPDLWLDINGIGMGNTLKIGSDTATASITVKAEDDNYPLTKVTLYKLHVTGEMSEQAAEDIEVDCSTDGSGRYVDSNTYTDSKEIVQEWNLTDQNLYTFSADVNTTVNDGDFYRIEVESEKNSSYDGAVAGAENEVGFAYSNPIWVEKTTDSTNDIQIGELFTIASNTTLKQTATGNYYVELDDEDTVLTSDDLTVTLSGNTTVKSKTYDPVNKVFNVALTAADGSVKELNIYVAAVPDPFTAVWKNGGVSIPSASTVGYSGIGYGFAKLSVTDARGYIPTPNLDESPYYLLLGMDGLMPAGSEADGGRWARLHISSGERNCNWYANDEIYIVFPNAGSSSRNITVIDSKDGTAQMEGVPFMPQTAYVFKFAKENNMLVIYCNGIKVFEGAEELDVFSDDNLWFTTKGNVGAYDTYTSYPLLINPTSGMTEDPTTYYTTGPKSGCNGYSSYVTDVTAENMMALYDSEGYVGTTIDSTYNDGGNPAQVGESVSTNISNTNKQFEISVIADSVSNGNWCTIGVYDPSIGEKSFAQSGNTLRFNMTGGVYNSLSFYYDGGNLPLIETDARVTEGELNKFRFELVSGDVNQIIVYYNDVLQKTILDTDENTAELFSLMNAETLRVGIVGNKGTTNLENPDIIRFKVTNGTPVFTEIPYVVGAQIRESDQALRFVMKVKQSVLDDLADYKNVEIGTILVNADKFVGSALEVTNKTSGFGSENPTTLKNTCAFVPENCAYEGYKVYTAVITSVNTNVKKATSVAVRAYIKVTLTNGSTYVCYSSDSATHGGYQTTYNKIMAASQNGDGE